MKRKLFRKKQKSIAERKTETRRKTEVPYKAVGLGLLLWLFVTWLFFGSGIVRHIDIAEGQRVPSTITAEVDFECEDLRKTKLNSDQASDAVPPVFTIDPIPAQNASKVVGELFNRLQRLTTATSNEYQRIESSMGDLLIGSSVDAKNLISVFPSNQIASSKAALATNIVNIMAAGILSGEYSRTLFRDAPDRRLTITDSDSKTSTTVSQQDIYSTQRARHTICETLGDANQRELADRLLATLVIDNMTYDETATEALRNEANQRVEPVMQ
ncbi:MAG: hypothetical protein DRP64_13375, partial [Verrucomicrobia bacterium]